VRKDLSYFGTFGRRGLGYSLAASRARCGPSSASTAAGALALVGAGNIGSALFAYKEFARQGFDIVAVFDESVDRIGSSSANSRSAPWRTSSASAASAASRSASSPPPAKDAQQIADLMAGVGLRGILNFAPRKLFVPRPLALRTVNMAIELESLSFALAQDDHSKHGRRRFPLGD